MELLFWIVVYWICCAVILHLVEGLGGTWKERVFSVILAGCLPWVILYFFAKDMSEKLRK